MRIVLIAALFMMVVLVAGCQSGLTGSQTSAAHVVYDIPRLEGITVDGSDSDWGSNGMRIPLILPPTGKPKDCANYDLEARLAWCNDGMLVLATIRDDLWSESPNLLRNADTAAERPSRWHG